MVLRNLVGEEHEGTRIAAVEVLQHAVIGHDVDVGLTGDDRGGRLTGPGEACRDLVGNVVGLSEDVGVDVVTAARARGDEVHLGQRPFLPLRRNGLTHDGQQAQQCRRRYNSRANTGRNHSC